MAVISKESARRFMPMQCILNHVDICNSRPVTFSSSSANTKTTVSAKTTNTINFDIFTRVFLQILEKYLVSSILTVENYWTNRNGNYLYMQSVGRRQYTGQHKGKLSASKHNHRATPASLSLRGRYLLSFVCHFQYCSLLCRCQTRISF